MKPITIIPIAIFAALVVIFGLYLWQVGPGGKDISQLPSAMIDKPVPQFKLPPILGRKDGLTTSDLKGKVSLINVWASWCPPCRAEHPILMTLARDGVTIFGINIRDKPKNAKRFLDLLGNPYARIGADTKGRVSIDLGVYGYPETFFIDAKGRIRYRHVGSISPGQLDSIIRPLLKELEG
ncbi:MAG: Thiol:disulfide interchange protein CycY [Alphaproteobacteria bacterium MarineAlpha11_Bin1]|nr:MAG: Thiol:disulfide interchange protein CycY [Alphaproteobacteria bacterium MarineAlpha11_Bin1]|tara:strand:- start:4572 stop:5114 length:543 start_codon:yes stop_codon:yes gene_type:complete